MHAHEETIGRILELIFERFHYDFRAYASTSIRRRLETALAAAGLPNLEALEQKLRHEETFFSWLLQYLTVGTTEMFRDPQFFRALREKVIPILKTYPSLKIWIAGTSTGEEAYSMAILLHEEGLLEKSLIYATDINPVSLATAEKGIYALDRLPKYSSNYLEAGGTKSLSDYIFTDARSAGLVPWLKSSLVFSDHSLATDASFGEMQLILCRNVLIYFTRSLQDRAVGLFAESLCHGGLLALGSKESLRFNSHAGSFEEIDRSWKIFQKKFLKGAHS